MPCERESYGERSKSLMRVPWAIAAWRTPIVSSYHGVKLATLDADIPDAFFILRLWLGPFGGHRLCADFCVPKEALKTTRNWQKRKSARNFSFPLFTFRFFFAQS